jgi:hypothetical protein
LSWGGHNLSGPPRWDALGALNSLTSLLSNRGADSNASTRCNAASAAMPQALPSPSGSGGPLYVPTSQCTLSHTPQVRRVHILPQIAGQLSRTARIVRPSVSALLYPWPSAPFCVYLCGCHEKPRAAGQIAADAHGQEAPLGPGTKPWAATARP